MNVTILFQGGIFMKKHQADQSHPDWSLRCSVRYWFALRQQLHFLFLRYLCIPKLSQQPKPYLSRQSRTTFRPISVSLRIFSQLQAAIPPNMPLSSGRPLFRLTGSPFTAPLTPTADSSRYTREAALHSRTTTFRQVTITTIG